MIDSGESRRLRLGPEPAERPSGIGVVRFAVSCEGNADTVLRNSREVMEVVLRFSARDWPSPSAWRLLLPTWFIAKCAPEMSLEEAERSLEMWRKLSPDEQIEQERQAVWSLADWKHWMHPNERQWSWWEARVDRPNQLFVAVVVSEWPFAWGALSWLLRASGALYVAPENDNPAAELDRQ